YIYAILLLTGLIITFFVASLLTQKANELVLIGLITALAAGIFTSQVYPRFSDWSERRLLGLPSTPVRLLDEVTTRITTSLDLGSLVKLVRDECFPALFIRQAALLRIDESGNPIPIFHLGI